MLDKLLWLITSSLAAIHCVIFESVDACVNVWSSTDCHLLFFNKSLRLLHKSIPDSVTPGLLIVPLSTF